MTIMFQPDRQQTRQIFINAWQKYTNKQTLEPLESMLVEIISMHPEYHRIFDQPDDLLEKDYLPESGETNPFLHMGLHVAIKEQVSIDQPTGITSLYELLISKHKDPHKVDHLIMDCLAEMIWESQRNNAMPDIMAYLSCIRSVT